MSEDEAIKQLQYLKNRKIGCGDWLINCKDRQAIEVILDLYKQEKEKNRSLQKEINLMKDYQKNAEVIFKDKIKEKLKKEEEEMLNDTKRGIFNAYAEARCKLYEELLKEE